VAVMMLAGVDEGTKQQSPFRARQRNYFSRTAIHSRGKSFNTRL